MVRGHTRPRVPTFMLEGVVGAMIRGFRECPPPSSWTLQAQPRGADPPAPDSGWACQVQNSEGGGRRGFPQSPAVLLGRPQPSEPFLRQSCPMETQGPCSVPVQTHLDRWGPGRVSGFGSTEGCLTF